MKNENAPKVRAISAPFFTVFAINAWKCCSKTELGEEVFLYSPVNKC